MTGITDGVEEGGDVELVLRLRNTAAGRLFLQRVGELWRGYARAEGFDPDDATVEVDLPDGIEA